MKDTEFLQQKLTEELESAHYLLEKTYPLVKENKIFLAVLEHLRQASVFALEYFYLFLYEKEMIGSVPKSLEEMQVRLVNHAQILDISREDLENFRKSYEDLEELEEAQKNDLISFKRKDSYVICKKNYKVQVVSLSLLQCFYRDVALVKRLW